MTNAYTPKKLIALVITASATFNIEPLIDFGTELLQIIGKKTNYLENNTNYPSVCYFDIWLIIL